MTNDLRYALRALKRSPGFTALAVITLGLGIGAATAGFSLLNRLLLQPLPGVRDARRVGFVSFMQPLTASWAPPGSFTPASLNTPQRESVARAAPAVLELAGWQGPMPVNAAALGATPIRVQTAFVTADFLHVLGTGTVLGRLFTPGDDQPPGQHVAVIGDRLWSELYGRRPDVLGSSLTLNGVAFTVVGVTSEGFRGPDRLWPIDLWLPGATYFAVQHWAHVPPDPDISYYRHVLRLRAGTSFDQAAAELQDAVRGIARTDSDQFSTKVTATVTPAGLERGGDALAHELRLILAVAGLVLLVACANVANLLLFRRAERRADLVVRLSLGAGSARLVRLLLTESAVLGLGGAAAGVVIAFGLRTTFGHLRFFRSVDIGLVPIDWRVIGFGVVAGVVTALLAGVAPAFLATHVDLNAQLKASGPNQAGGWPKLRVGLAVVQVAASLALVAGAYLFADTLRNYAKIPLGFEPASVTVFANNLRDMGYDAHRTRAYYEALTARLKGAPGVGSVALVDVPPFAGVTFSVPVRAAGGRADVTPLNASSIQAGPEYFAVLGIPMLRGRPFVAADMWPDSQTAAKVVILSAGAAHRMFGDRDPVSQLVEFPRRDHPTRALVIGVVGDVRSDLVGPVEPVVYQPIGQDLDPYSPMVLVKSSLPTTTVEREAQVIGSAVDADLPLESRGALTASIAATIAEQHLFFRIVGILSLLTLLLTAAGVYGIVAYGLTTRTREFGIRMALGAVPANLVRIALAPGVTIVLAGSVMGVLGALYLTKFIASSLYGVSRFDPLAFSVAALVLAAAVLLASWLPARRAAVIDPMVALRYE